MYTEITVKVHQSLVYPNCFPIHVSVIINLHLINFSYNCMPIIVKKERKNAEQGILLMIFCTSAIIFTEHT